MCAAPTPSGPLSLVLSNARELIGDTAGWQTWTGEDADGAKEHIYIGGIDMAIESGLRPWIFINTENHKFPTIAGGSSNQFTENGEINGIVRATIPDEYQDQSEFQNSILDFLNKLGAVTADMMGLAFQSGYINLRDPEIVDYQRSPKSEEINTPPYVEGAFKFRFGLDAG